LALLAPLLTARAIGADAPPWMHALTGVPTPAHDDKANAAELYAETVVTVKGDGWLHRLDRGAYRILRPDGEERSVISAYVDANEKITAMTAWCIPSSGKDFVVRERDAVETALPGILNGELASDERAKLLKIPAATPGSLIGYEIEEDQRSQFIDDEWTFQDDIPVRESHYTLQLPPGWGYRAAWINHADVAPTEIGKGRWTWVVNDIPAVPIEKFMPPWRGIAARLVISLIPPASNSEGWATWKDVGKWYDDLSRSRRDASPEIRARTAELASPEPTLLGKISALARFVQTDVRYVAIELGIGGHQPHPAADVFRNRYGDCKDKATLLSSMLKEIGVDSYLVVINTVRGSVTPDMPANLTFNHVILAIAIPPGTDDPRLLATFDHPTLGKLLFFDPTDPLTPLGRLSGPLQANYGLVVYPNGGDLVRLPELAPATNAVQRVAKAQLDEHGTLRGDITETRLGDPAAYERERLANVRDARDDIRSVESLVSDSMATFHIEKARVENRDASDAPIIWHYSLATDGYAKTNGGLLLVRPRLLGSEASGFLETPEARRQPIEFDGPLQATDSFEIEVPAHYQADELPPPVNADIGFAVYHSKTEMTGRVLKYTRSFEIKELSVPAAKAEDLKKLYRVIAADERRTIVLTQAGQ